MAVFIVGLFIGGLIGVLIMAIMNMAGKGDDKCERFYFAERHLTTGGLKACLFGLITMMKLH